MPGLIQRLRYRGRTAPAPLCILRVHKTGSKSFRKAFMGCYADAEIGPTGTSPGLTAADFAGRAFAAPHLSVQGWLDLGDETGRWTVAVTLREPRARLRSAYRYFRGYRDDHPTGSGLLLRDLDYAGFLTSEDPEILGMRDNILARFLGGARFGADRRGRNKLFLPEGTTIEACAAAALERVRSGAFHPLILEAPEVSVAALARAIGLRRPPPLPWVNRTDAVKRQADLGSGFEAAEEAAIRHDLPLYAAARDRLGL